MKNSKKPQWITMNEAALPGGIMVTGSIGSGKSVATLLPWSEQLLNFKPTPSFLVVDPKLMFAEDFIELVDKKGISDRVFHFKFDGDVKINPIYRKNVLKNGAFAEVANMIRAAQINFMGRESGDSKFWGIKSNDLVKNTIRFCAGTQGNYFTLIDFYTALVEANSRDYALEIHDSLEKNYFDEEEKANLEFTAQYFDNEYNELDDKIKSGITATATAFLSQLMEYKASQILCPKEEDVTLWSMDEIVDGGKILVLDIRNQGLARAIGTIVRLQYQASVLSRYSRTDKSKNKGLAVTIVDEYPDVASVGGGEVLGDDTYRAKCRGANGVDIYASQGHTSLESAVNDKNATQTLLLNFRTHISLHSLDEKTAEFFGRVGGEEEIEKENESFSESGKKPIRNFVSGEVISQEASVTRSVSRTKEKRKRITAEKLAKLNTFEACGLVFLDGVKTEFFEKIYLKPAFLEKKETPHKEVLRILRKEPKKSLWKKVTSVLSAIAATFTFSSASAMDWPSVCSVVNTPQFEKIFDFKTSLCTCGFPPMPCIYTSYNVPFLFTEVRESGSFFSSYPGSGWQLTLSSQNRLRFGGIGEEGGYFYQARNHIIPLTSYTFNRLPCGGASEDKFCFDAMSEHLGENWYTPQADLLQPKFHAWATVGPKLCVLKGAASSVGGSPPPFSPGAPMCSTPRNFIPKYPPSKEPVCTGWGQLIPRCGFVEAESTVNASLLAGAKFKSLATEIFKTTPSYPDELWQMIYPNSSGAFRRGQNLGYVSLKFANERGRMNPTKSKGFLYAHWHRVSCCRSLDSVPNLVGIMLFMKSVCAGMR